MIDLSEATLAELEIEYEALDTVLLMLATERDEAGTPADIARLNGQIAETEKEMNYVLEAMKRAKKEVKTKELQVTLNEEIQKGTQHTFAMVPGGDAKAKDRAADLAQQIQIEEEYIEMLIKKIEQAKYDVSNWERSLAERQARIEDLNTLYEVTEMTADRGKVAQKSARDIQREMAIKLAIIEGKAQLIEDKKAEIRKLQDEHDELVQDYMDLNELFEEASDAEQDVLTEIRQIEAKYPSPDENDDIPAGTYDRWIDLREKLLVLGTKESKVTEELAEVAEKAADPAEGREETKREQD